MDTCGDQQLYSNAFRRLVSSRAGLNEQRKARPHSHIPAVTDGALPRPSVAMRLAGYKGQRLKKSEGSMKSIVPLEQDEQIAFVQWCRLNGIRGKDWRIAEFGVPGYLINEFGDMVTTRLFGKKYHMLRRQTDKQGYQYYGLSVNGKRNFKIKIHRAVALTFLSNPHNCKIVNHKNGVKDDNRVENLEWTTASGNLLHAYRKLGYKSKGGVPRKKVQCVETGVIFGSVREAARFVGPGTSNTAISGAANNKIKKSKGSTYKVTTCGGYHWRFV